MSRPAALRRPLALYAGGQASVLAGAWCMQETGSMLPMALAASACLMLTAPLVRYVLARRRSR